MAEDAVGAAISALRAGGAVVLPTDGVYGLCVQAEQAEAAAALARLKGRAPGQPCAMLAADVDVLLECVPELRGRAEAAIRALLPGPYTLVVANPARRYPWLTGARPETIGVRVAQLPALSAAVLEAVRVVGATSANRSGGDDPSSLEQVPAAIRAGCAAELDAGRLPGRPSTVLDFSGPEPVVLRAGAGEVEGALARARAAMNAAQAD